MSKRRQSEVDPATSDSIPASDSKKAKRGSAAAAAASADVQAIPTAVTPVDADTQMDDVHASTTPVLRHGRSPAPGRSGTPAVENTSTAAAASSTFAPPPAPVDPNAIAPSPIHLCRSDMGPHLKLSTPATDGALTITGNKGYRMIRGTHGLAEGAMYFEAKWLPSPELIVSGKKTIPAVRIGVATTDADIQAPVGYDIHSYAFCSVSGRKAHNAHVSEYASTGFNIGDVVGVWLVLPPDVNAISLAADQAAADPQTKKANGVGGKKAGAKGKKKNIQQEFAQELMEKEAEKQQLQDEPAEEPESKLTDAEVVQSKKFHKRSFLRFYRNGHSVVGPDAPLASAFTDILRAKYFPAISLYMGATVKLNFGPDYWCPPDEVMAGVAAAQTAQAAALTLQQQQNGGGENAMTDIPAASSTVTSVVPLTFPTEPTPAIVFRHPLSRLLLTSGLFPHLDGSGTQLVPNPIQTKANADAEEEARQKKLVEMYALARKKGLVQEAHEKMAEASAAAVANAANGAPVGGTSARAAAKNAN